ncbi:hypothetical protein [Shewanella indica]|uniref:hypothetical protein n=1 Tax=Shewanella indica TaxID=768528 RepID=UPI0020434971|nr:hypothetical protein [Shewanella indica]
MNLTKLALKRPVTTSMFFVAILLFGLAASRLLPLEMFPGIEIPRICPDINSELALSQHSTIWSSHARFA